MFRKAATAALLLCLSTSSSVFALGLGDIEIQSALNQPFRAVVELTSASDEDLQQLQVSLAPREAYERAGIPRAGILSEFRFSVDRTSAGKPVIRITSTVPVQEPFLDFLLEAVWSRGRLVRQYTVLVDPPVTMPATPVAPAAPVSRAPRPAPVTSAPAPQQSAPRPVRPPVAPTRAAPPPPAPAPVDEYGPVRRSETLWQIARQVRPGSDISMQQMMIALQRANPSAFIKDNINNLKAGATLQIPSRDEILALSRADARNEVNRQHTEWKDGRTAPVAEVPAPAPEAAETAAAAVAGEPESAAEPETESAPAVAGEGASEVVTESRLQLVAPEEEAIEGAVSPGETEPGFGQDAETGALAEQLAMATEEAEASRAQSEELQSRVSTLEEQVTQLQRLLELKDEELASMQNRVAGDDMPIQVEESASATPVDDGELAPAPETAAEAAAPAAMETEEAVATEDTAADRQAQHEPRRLVDRLLDNPVLTGLGVLVAMVLGGFLWASTRQRRSVDIFEDEPTLASRLAQSREEIPPPAPAITIREDSVSEESMFSDTAATDVSPLHGEGESDPLTEADVFIAYGRTKQAEEVIQTALKKNPTDNELKVKLMEIYYTAGNIGAFDSHADSFRRMVDEADPLWQQVATMGHELSATNPLYKSAEQDQPAEVAMEDLELSAADTDLAEITEITEITEIAESVPDETEEVKAGGAPEEMEFTLEGLTDQSAGEEHDEHEAEGLLESNDEVATKLDLARAYMDMGDPDGARSILEEVLAEGNEHQVSEAEELISRLT